MKIKALLLSITVTMISNSAFAQVSPDVDHSNPKDLISIKTDPVLSDPKGMISVKTDPVLKNPLDMIGVKTDPVLSDPKEMIFVKTDPVLKTLSESIDGLSINFEPVMDLINSLEASGAKVTYRIVESDGLILLEVSVNGKMLTPFILNAAKIEFEY